MSFNPGKLETIFSCAVIPTVVIGGLQYDGAICLIPKELCLHVLPCNDNFARDTLFESRNSATAKIIFS